MEGASTAPALYAASVSASQVFGAAPEDVKKLKHHLKDGKGFRNPWDSYIEMNAFKMLRAFLWRRLTGKSNIPDTTPPTVPVRPPQFLGVRDAKSPLRATWLGHACYYVEFPGGFRALFDPVFTSRCSPFSWLGPKRYTEMPCNIADIPTVDAVMISHSHYDHLSHPTVMEINKRHPNCHFFVPLGNKKWFEECGIHSVTELDWWESRDISLTPSEQKVESQTGSAEGSDIKATISCLPCQHTSARTPFDRNHTLWASWAVESAGKKVWFGGDTGYRGVPELPADVDDYDPKLNLPHCPAFKEIGKLRGPFDLGLIPIGAYQPRWFMSSMHANPFDSVNIFVDTKCRRGLGMHWGTWVLTEEDVLEPPRLLKKALEAKGIAPEGVFDVCEIGESREFAD
ncbi:beta-lactamase superfamily domain-containing protein [Lineolata rhizophorae]|uniref:Beta-lactamase superfamily domain-containing protein n=1 Tax=Lineolata rhizophorae TaxID=578093 RepID=A0A6A6P2B5_9PEZI|nr:beta-lactamase superfamily domain-containing protein [Lineolata rhizophorae]